MKYALIPLLLAAPAAAQDFATRDTDTLPSAETLAAIILDHDLEYFGGGGYHGYNSLEGTFLGGCIFSGRAAGRSVG